MKLATLRIILFGLIAVSLTACSPHAASLDFASRVESSWTTSVALVGSPSAAAGVVVSYVDTGEDALEIVAWEVETGDELWRDTATLGSAVRYGANSARIVTIGGSDFVTYLQDDPADDQGWQRVVVADLHSGAHRDDGSLVLDAIILPGECEKGDGVCVRGRAIERSEGEPELLRVDLAANRLVSEPGPNLPANARFLGGNVYSTLGRAPDGIEVLGYATDGIVQWERPYTEVYAPGYSSDGGWSWLDEESRDVIVGTGGPYDPSTAENPVEEIRLPESMAVGLDAESGRTIWSVAGADRLCDAVDLNWSLLEEVIPMCVFASGTVTIDRTDPDNPTLVGRDIDARLVGVDSATGDELWSIDAGDDPSLAYDWTGSFASDLAVRPVMIKNTLMMVDIVTGEVRDVPDGAGFACESDRDPFVAHRPANFHNEPTQYSGGLGIFACDTEHHEVTDGFSPGALEMAATDAGDGWFIVGGSNSLAGYRAS